MLFDLSCPKHRVLPLISFQLWALSTDMRRLRWCYHGWIQYNNGVRVRFANTDKADRWEEMIQGKRKKTITSIIRFLILCFLFDVRSLWHIICDLALNCFWLQYFVIFLGSTVLYVCFGCLIYRTSGMKGLIKMDHWVFIKMLGNTLVFISSNFIIIHQVYIFWT